MAELGRRPETTYAYRTKKARKDHRCRDCGALIQKGTLYFQDDYYAPFGNGARFCLACGKANKQAEVEWCIAFDLSRGQPKRGTNT